MAQVSTAYVGERAPHGQNQEGDRHWCRLCEAAAVSPHPRAFKPELFGSLKGRGADPLTSGARGESLSREALVGPRVGQHSQRGCSAHDVKEALGV